MTVEDSNDEQLALSSSALDALKEFYAERDAKAEQFLKLQAEADRLKALEPVGPLSMELFTEDWNESQFWYSDETANLYAKQLLEGATAESTIAVVSTPSVFMAIKNIMMSPEAADKSKPKIVLLEHDHRFDVFPEFVFYDYAHPFKLPGNLKGSVDRLIVDPPFLSSDCHTKFAMTVRWMAKNQDSKIIICSGERMEPLVLKVYKHFGVQTTTYEPIHAKQLGNEFYCYANFEPADESWKWKPSSE